MRAHVKGLETFTSLNHNTYLIVVKVSSPLTCARMNYKDFKMSYHAVTLGKV